jgi:hypothetical protein
MPKKSAKLQPIDLNRVKRYPLARRTNKTEVSAFGRPLKKIRGVDFFESLPDFLKAADLKEFISLVIKARKQDFPFHLLMGAHIIKVGLSPVIIDLMKHSLVTGLSFHGAAVIHDLELAFFGGTSEDVQAGLLDGSFGMTRDTAKLFAELCELADRNKIGLGEATGHFINEAKAKHRKLSIFGMAHQIGLPVTVHIGVGTDIVCQHPEYNAARAATASYLDFRILCSLCRTIDRGGVVANIGSAVILPEVFLKALTVARNVSRGKSRLVTANFDMITHYRPTENVVKRPTFKAGKGFNFVGHHEIMVPLLAWGLKLKFKS